jgi:hypothetical protein
MRPTPRLSRPRPDGHTGRRGPTPGTVLGPHHPLTRARDALGVVARQASVAGGVLAAAGVATAAGVGWALAVDLGAVIVLVVLAVVAGALHERERRWTLELIREGRERLPLDCVSRQRRRLLDRRTRLDLAESLESVAQEALPRRRAAMRTPPPLFDRRVVAAVADELRGLAALLRGEPTSARGVAHAERLLTDSAVSPLYGHDVGALRAELHRVLYLQST